MNVPEIQYVMIAPIGADNPRNDTASVVELPDRRLLAVWHKYTAGPKGSSDFGDCRIYSKTSSDGGLTWHDERMLIDIEPGNLNVQAPALCLLPSGELLLICLRAHARDSSTMCLFRSEDLGETFGGASTIWERSNGQWLQGGASSLVRLSGGRLLLPFHGGDGDQWSQHNIVRCFLSDDEGYSWRLNSSVIDLPMRGAMEASVAELENRRLAMSLRSQLGAVFLSYSDDGGETWSLPQTSGLRVPESCTCLRRVPGSNDLVLFWNDSLYDPGHGWRHYGERCPLSAALSRDGGQTWRKLGDIDTGAQFTNLDCTFALDGRAIVTYYVYQVGEERPLPDHNLGLKAAILQAEWFTRR
jgi:sialidase-1